MYTSNSCEWMHVEKAKCSLAAQHVIGYLFFVVLNSVSLPRLIFRGGGDSCKIVEEGGGLEFLVKMRVIQRKIIYKKEGSTAFHL